MVKLEYDNIVLRRWRTSDKEQLAKIANNRKISDNLKDSFPYPYSIDDAKNFICLQQYDDSFSKIFAIEIDNKIAGCISFFIKDDIYRKNAEIGYYLGEEYWGRGVMTKVIKVVVEYIFNNYDVFRIYAEPFAKNIRSRKVLEKNGFKLEAILRCNVFKNGKFENSCIYSILKYDYFNR